MFSILQIKSKSSKSNQDESPKYFRGKLVDYFPKKYGFTFGEKISEGSYGLVMKSQFEEAKLVCKYLDRQLMPNLDEKFLVRELHFHSILEHPNIIFTHSIFQKDSKYFIFMEPAKTDLLRYINDNTLMSEARAKELFFQLVSGIKYMHSMFAAHRDLKLENIFISFRNKIKIGDFGYAY